MMQLSQSAATSDTLKLVFKHTHFSSAPSGIDFKTPFRPLAGLCLGLSKSEVRCDGAREDDDGWPGLEAVESRDDERCGEEGEAEGKGETAVRDGRDDEVEARAGVEVLKGPGDGRPPDCEGEKRGGVGGGTVAVAVEGVRVAPLEGSAPETPPGRSDVVVVLLVGSRPEPGLLGGATMTTTCFFPRSPSPPVSRLRFRLPDTPSSPWLASGFERRAASFGVHCEVSSTMGPQIRAHWTGMSSVGKASAEATATRPDDTKTSSACIALIASVDFSRLPGDGRRSSDGQGAAAWG